MSYLGNSPLNKLYAFTPVTLTATQTVVTISYTPSMTLFFLKLAAGTTKLLEPGIDITATDGSSVTLASGAAAGDKLIGISLAQFNVQTMALGADMAAGVDAFKLVSPKSMADAAVFIALTDAATVAWDASLGFNAKVTLGGNRTIGAPTNMKDGLTYTLRIQQDATGGRTGAFNAIWLFPFTPVLSTAAGAVDYVWGQYDATLNKIVANFRKVS